ncbi:MAG: Stk1 family PASTA domain-containing Ser/Thr kinase [Mobilicoccus sp.]|nr:Stk1 family PASTA domain-containing Ser/Thr kinase [Mobilicoccus sp.]
MSDEQRLLAGRYEVGELIGRGGMADVHLGFDTRLGREVAVKILRSELARDRSFLMRFRREAQSAASLNHPAIVAVFDSGEDSVVESGGAPVSVPFIVMEYVRGDTLRDVLTEHGPMEPFEAARIMAQVLRALDYSHEGGIIHRDVKPANVMLGANGEAKVMDFGIARAIADTAATMTNTSVVVGTAQYLSPEQAQGQDVDARSDLYSAGCLLYELITGRPPFIGDSPVAIAYQHVGQPPQPPSVHATGIPASLDVVTLHSLGKEPESRYQSGAAFADDLDAVVTGGSTLAAREAAANGDRGEPATGSTMAVPAPVPEEPPAPVVTTTDEVVEEEPERKRTLWPYAVGLLALLAVVMGVLFALGVFEPDGRTVPTVVDRTEEEARATLTEAGFEVATQPVEHQSQPGTVVDQNPRGQTTQPVGSTITLSVSSGPGSVTIPDLRNYEQQLARDRLTSLGLEIGDIDTVDSSSVDQGKVVSTDPAAGERVEPGSFVKLAISSGRVEVPEVVGLSESAAAEALGKVGLRASVTQVESNQERGTVIAQAYPQGTRVPVGDVIALSVAIPRTPVPTVTETVTETPTETPTPTPTPTTDEPQPPQDPDGTDTPETPDPAETPTG